MAVSKEKLQKVVEYFEVHGKEKTAEKFNVSLESLRRYINRAKELGIILKTDDLSLHYEESGDTATVEHKHVKTLDELLLIAKVDLEIWEVERYVINKWDVTMGAKASQTGSIERRQNWQIKAWLKKKTGIIDYAKFKREFIEDMKQHSERTPKKDYPALLKKQDKNALVVNIFDLHLGKLTWQEETGHNYDVKIARKIFFEALDGLIHRSRGFKYELIIFPLCNDFFHTDSAYPYPQTTKGTPQQEDLRWQKVFRTGRIMTADALIMLSKIAPVKAPVIPGNHDFMKSFFLGDALECKFENNPNITVLNSANSRKYIQYGNTLFGFTHGRESETPIPRLLTLMPQEQPQLWAKTKFREWHLGDIHHKREWKIKSEEDKQGIIIRYMRSLSGSDAWHHNKAYVGAIHGAEAYVYNIEYGKVANFDYNLIY